MNRSEKSKRGFREFGNVTELMLNLVQIGDPSYQKQDLEKFCKTRLFRHSKTRAKSKVFRKSSCRVKQRVSRKNLGSDVEHVCMDRDELMDIVNAGDEGNGGIDDKHEIDEDQDSATTETSEDDEDSHQPMDSDDSSE